MFKFNFSQNKSDSSIKEDLIENDDLEWIPAAEVPVISDSIKSHENWGIRKTNGYELHYIPPTQISSFIESNMDIVAADIIPAKYEGGFKVWDCTHHLLDYLTNSNCQINLKNTTVLDLGCGNGLLGILALKLGANSVHFQDYNEDVIRIVTIPSVLKNLETINRNSSDCKCFSGDWLSFSELNSDLYDIILTSATIYNTSNYKKLLKVFKKKLKPTGLVLVAAKTYYFGNGGGTRQFEEALEKDGAFQSEVLWASTDGVQQEILKVTNKK